MPLDTWLGGGADDNFDTNANWKSGTSPVANDDIVITGSNPMNGGDYTSSLELDSISIREMSGQIGSADAYLQLDVADGARVEIQTLGLCYLDLGNAAVDVLITGTATATYPLAGLYLKGSALQNITIVGISHVMLVDTTQTGSTVLQVGESAVVQSTPGGTIIDASVEGNYYHHGVAGDLRAYNGGVIHRYGSDGLAVLGAYNGGTVNDYGGGTMTAVEAFGGNIFANLNSVARIYSAVDARDGGSVQVSAETTVSAVTGRAEITG
jgi:hypothetical protein